MCMYAAYPARFFLSQSVDIFIYLVGLSHVNSGLPNSLLDNLILSSVLKSICWVYGTASRPRFPLTINIVIAVHSKVSLSSSEHISFWAICLTKFFLACSRNLFYCPHPITLLIPISSLLSGLTSCMMCMILCWECIGATPFSFGNIQLFLLLGFLLNPYIRFLSFCKTSP